jgi:hypothetical protein
MSVKTQTDNILFVNYHIIKTDPKDFNYEKVHYLKNEIVFCCKCFHLMGFFKIEKRVPLITCTLEIARESSEYSGSFRVVLMR